MKKFVASFLFALAVLVPAFASAQTVPSCYQFTRDLTLGSTGADVVAFQQIMIAGGYLTMPAGEPLGYFGTLTQRAGQMWQTANGIAPASGYIGPVSRAKLNSCVVPPVLDLTLKTVASENQDRVLFVDEDGDDQVEIYTFSIRASATSSLLANELPITVRRTASSYGPNSSISSLILYADGVRVGGRETVPTSCANSCTITFDGLDLEIEAGDEVEFVVAARTRAMDFSGDNLYDIQALIDIANLNFEYDNGNRVPVSRMLVVGSANGGIITFAEDGEFVAPEVQVMSGNLRLRYAETTSGALEASFLVEIQANNGDVVIPKYALVSEMVNTKGQTAAVSEVVFEPITDADHPLETVDCGYRLQDTCYLLRKGTDSEDVQFKYVLKASPLQSFGGSYVAKITDIRYLDSDRQTYKTLNLTDYVTNSVVIVGERSPYITSVRQIDPTHFSILGERVNIGTIYIDGRVHPGVGTATERKFDGVFAAGKHQLQIKDTGVGDSNIVGFDVGGVSGTFSGTMVEKPRLYLRYTEATKESLTVDYLIKITAGDAESLVPVLGGLTSSLNNTAGQGANRKSRVVSIVLQPGQSMPAKDSCVSGGAKGECYILPKGSSYTFKISDAYSPREMFPGSYTAQAAHVYRYVSSGAQYVEVVPESLRSSNAITIVGEVSPFITSVTSPVSVGQKMTINGFRLFGPDGSSKVYIDNVLTSALVDGSKDGTVMFFTLPALAAGQHQLQIKNANFGNSNIVRFDVGGVTNDWPGFNIVTDTTSYTLQDTVNLTLRRADGKTAGYDVDLYAYKSESNKDTSALIRRITVAGETKASISLNQYPVFNQGVGTYVFLLCKRDADCRTGYGDGSQRNARSFQIVSAPTITPKIDVQFPNGGETISAGAQVDIKWTKNFSTSKVTHIDLIGTNGSFTKLTPMAGISGNASSFSAAIPENLAAGTYRARVTVCPEVVPSGYNCIDESNGTFQVIPKDNVPFAKITKPTNTNPLTYWRRKSNQTVTWTPRSGMNLNVAHLTLVNQSTGAQKSLATNLPADQGSYTFYLPMPGEVVGAKSVPVGPVMGAGGYKMRITVCPKDFYGYSGDNRCNSEGGAFVIGEPSTPTTTSSVNKTSLVGAVTEAIASLFGF